MVEATATATEMKNNLGKYLQMIMRGNEVIITKNGVEIGRLIPSGTAKSYLTDSLRGIVKGNYYPDDEKEAVLAEKYEMSSGC